MKRFLQLLRNELVTGAVLLAPIAGTLYLVIAVVRAMDGLFPDELRPRVLGVPLPGLGIGAVVVLMLLVGLFAHNFIGRRLVDWFDRAFQRVPLFGGFLGGVVGDDFVPALVCRAVYGVPRQPPRNLHDRLRDGTRCVRGEDLVLRHVQRLDAVSRERRRRRLC